MRYFKIVFLGALFGFCVLQVGCNTTSNGSGSRLNPQPQVSDGFSAIGQPSANPIRASFNTFRR